MTDPAKFSREEREEAETEGNKEQTASRKLEESLGKGEDDKNAHERGEDREE